MCDKVMAIRKEVKQQKSKMEQLQDDYEKQAAKAKVRGFFSYIPVVVWTVQ